MRNLLLSAPHNNFWKHVASELKKTNDAHVKFWVGSGDDSNTGDYDFYNAWHAFSLSERSRLGIKGNAAFDLSRLSMNEYFSYIKLLDRVDIAGNMSFSERHHLLAKQMGFWKYIIEHRDIDYIIFSNVPHLPHNYPLYLCAIYLGIDINIINVTPFVGLFYLTDRVDGKPQHIPSNLTKLPSLEFVVDEVIMNKKFGSIKKPWYMQKQEHREKINLDNPLMRIRNFLSRINSDKNGSKSSKAVEYVIDKFYSRNKIRSFKTSRESYAFRRLSVPFEALQALLIRHELKVLQRRHDAEVGPRPNAPYFYFPLHYQPEATTSPYGGLFADQLSAIQAVASSLPDGVILVVKEHPSQFMRRMHGHGGRYRGYWKEIKEFKNVVIVDVKESSEELIKNCIGVVTVTGTAGWEALVNGKPCILFGNAWYSECSGAYRADHDNIQNIVRKCMVSGIDYAGAAQNFIEDMREKLFLCDMYGHSGDKLQRDPAIVTDIIRWHMRSTLAVQP